MKVLSIAHRYGNEYKLTVTTPAGNTVISGQKEGENITYLDENLEKQIAVIEIAPAPAKKKKTSSLDSFTFYVEYAHASGDDGARRKETTVRAKDYDSALAKVYRNFKTI